MRAIWEEWKLDEVLVAKKDQHHSYFILKFLKSLILDRVFSGSQASILKSLCF